MGWLGGLLCMFAFYFVQWAASYMLASMYEVGGKKHGRYQDAVAAFLGEWPATGGADRAGTTVSSLHVTGAGT